MDPAGRHARRAGRQARHRRRRAGAHDRALERGCAPRATTPTSAAATAPSTAGGATRTARAAATPRSVRSSRGPYYAFEIHSGALGTKGGPRVDPDGRVLRHRRRPDPRPVRRRQRHGLAVRHDLRRPRWHARPGHGVRLPRRPPRRGPLRDRPDAGRRPARGTLTTRRGSGNDRRARRLRLARTRARCIHKSRLILSSTWTSTSRPASGR